MDLNKIEPLLIDYALGAAPLEVAALIEAYVEKDAAAHSQLAQWQKVVDLAQRAIPESSTAHDPAAITVFPAGQLQIAKRHARWRKAATLATALAACLALGFFAGIQINLPLNKIAVASTRGNQQPASATAELPIAAVQNFGSPAWWRTVVQQNANRPERSSTYTLQNLSALFHPTGG
jgi:anti-sigma factor RsiW